MKPTETTWIYDDHETVAPPMDAVISFTGDAPVLLVWPEGDDPDPKLVYEYDLAALLTSPTEGSPSSEEPSHKVLAKALRAVADTLDP